MPASYPSSPLSLPLPLCQRSHFCECELRRCIEQDGAAGHGDVGVEPTRPLAAGRCFRVADIVKQGHDRGHGSRTPVSIDPARAKLWATTATRLAPRTLLTVFGDLTPSDTRRWCSALGWGG